MDTMPKPGDLVRWHSPQQNKVWYAVVLDKSVPDVEYEGDNDAARPGPGEPANEHSRVVVLGRNGRGEAYPRVRRLEIAREDEMVAEMLAK